MQLLVVVESFIHFEDPMPPCTQLPFGSAVNLGNTVLLVVKAKGYVYFREDRECGDQ